MCSDARPCTYQENCWKFPETLLMKQDHFAKGSTLFIFPETMLFIVVLLKFSSSTSYDIELAPYNTIV